jgi:hypothetical protein
MPFKLNEKGVKSIDRLFRVWRPVQEFFTYMETTPLQVKGCKMYVYAWRSWPLSREESLSCHTCCDTGPRFFRSHPKDYNKFSRLLRHTRRCGGSILTRIFTGYRSRNFIFAQLPDTQAVHNCSRNLRGLGLVKILHSAILWYARTKTWTIINPIIPIWLFFSILRWKLLYTSKPNLARKHI